MHPMDIPDILAAFEHVQVPFPARAVAAARERREEITPHLLEVLDWTLRDAEMLAEEEDRVAHLFAMFLLAEFREERAFPALLALASLPADQVEDLLGDVATDGLERVLASVCGGETEPILQLVRNPEINEWVRGAGVRALACLVVEGVKSREEVIELYRGLYAGGLEDEPSNAWDELVSCSLDLHPEGLMVEIRDAYERDVVDSGFVGFGEAEAELEKGREAVLDALRENPFLGFVGSVEEEMASWACFSEENDEDHPDSYGWDPDGEDGGRSLEGSTWKPPTTVRREAPKVGRNEPCPCGSGKKFKKCCGS